MTDWLRRVRDDERGATLILVTLAFVVLLGFAAFAVDAAAARSQRRENQGGVDTAALSAIQLTANKLSAAAITDATDEVIRATYISIAPNEYPALADWRAAWIACSDTAKPAEYTITGISDCISFTQGLRRMRVHIPPVDWETTFGQVLGVDVIETGATAVVGVDLNAGIGATLPFGIPGGVANDGHLCLKTGPAPSSEDPCDGPTTGNFQFLDITWFGLDPGFGTTNQCNGGTTTRLASNIAQGIDHPLREASAAAAMPWLDRTLCGDGNFSARPYTLTTETGTGKGAAMMDGLVDGITRPDGVTLSGRITQPGGDEATVGPFTDIDDTPIWDFLTAGGLALCETYALDGDLDGDAGDHDAVVACLEDPINSPGGVWSRGIIFEDGLANAERFAWVPLFWDTTLGTGNTDHNIRDFRPVYLQTTFWSCDAVDCRYVHDPDEPLVVNPPITGSTPGISSLSAIQIPLGALPPSISVDADPGSDGVLVYSLFE
jgi:hypothetical protein